MEALKTVTISKRAELAVRGGHPWIYGSEIKDMEEGIAPGDMVKVLSSKGKFVGTGFYNPHSKITIRIFSTNANDRFDDAFWKRRAAYAVDYRLQVMRKEDYDCCRLVFGEADQLPGMTVDRFGDVLSVQVLSLGMEKRKHLFLDGLIEVLRERNLPVSCIYERNDVKIRELEGMEQYKGFYHSPLLAPEEEKTLVDIVENGIRYTVDVENGQKTGFFLDQKFNRLAAAQIARGRHVLDCFTHTGAFALNAAKGGAASVTALDISQEAVDMASHNGEINHLPIHAVKADVFEYLTNLDKTKNHDYDYIILDPPAFTKSGKTVHEAFRGYKEINYRAMKILPRGGYLATCSCSHFMGEELFVKMVKEAARDAGVTLRQIEFRQQAPDHPILMTVPETYYLKFFLFQIV
ncbi:class I SAM-dependent rRNA methyltransferase [uncultured Dialister sp.]|jgi:23S rRNA (cytosine1962-C5)-methyltransferase|uniref:class I SAM-dependent rRNA methyltransferase n=1 Tax=uncultured Dialister sp. TaxID=278064 RepID=UPI0025FCEAFD|nr:class I SAM-dependent rRNA methyltransferase [uncultured Dialister sp.]